MDEVTPARRWWRRKRWWAAGLLWLAATYVFGLWPVQYFFGRRVLFNNFGRVLLIAYDPLTPVVMKEGGTPRFGFGWYVAVANSFHELGARHAWEAAGRPVFPALPPRRASDGPKPAEAAPSR
jgi:hypothetical protein